MAVKNWLAAAAMSACVFGASTASAVTITNGSFEDDPIAQATAGNGTSWNVYPEINGWKSFEGDAGIEVQTGYVGGASAVHFDNKVELDSHGDGNLNSGMYQTLKNVAAGKYEVTFKYLGRTNDADTNGIHYGAADSLSTPVVRTDFNPGLAYGEVKGSYAATYNTGDWKLVSYLFTVDSLTDVTLAFWAGGAPDTLGGYIDDVNISAVPLPPAMLLFGGAMLGLGWLSRRRKAAASA